MAEYPHLDDWQGWLAKQKYANLDPFARPIPAPIAGIFDNSNGDLRTVCFNPAWSPVITGALSRLAVSELYLSNGDETVQDIYRFMNIVAGIGENPCLPTSIEATECAYYPSWYAGTSYTPNNPFDGSGFPDIFDVPPFIRFSAIDTWLPDWLDDFFFNVVENVTGYRENDIFVFPLSLEDQIDPYSGENKPYPTIKLTVEGTGTLRLKFLLFPFGGRAIISFDPVDILDIFTAIFTPDDRIIELNRDILASVPETDLDAIEEIVLEEDKTHEIYITFLPTINDEAPFVQYGGGFRGYELCGDLTLIDPATGEPINPDDLQMQEGMIMTTELDLLKALNRHRTLNSQAWLASIDPDLIGLDPSIINADISFNATEDAVLKNSNTSVGLGSPPDAIAEQSKMGGHYQQALSLKKLLDQAVALRTLTWSAAAIANTASIIVNPVNAVAWLDLITAFTGTSVVITIDPTALALKLYCNDVGTAIAEYAIDNSFTEDQTNYLTQFVAQIPASKFNEWYSEGLYNPIDGYKNAECYRLQPQTYIINNENFTGGNQFFVPLELERLNNRKWLVSIQGVLTGADGATWDGLYAVPNGGSASYKPVFWYNTSGSEESAPVEQPSYRSAGGYKVTYDHNDWQRLAWNPVLPAQSYSGQITLLIQDAGSNA